jgi:hypothetical protein
MWHAHPDAQHQVGFGHMPVDLDHRSATGFAYHTFSGDWDSWI